MKHILFVILCSMVGLCNAQSLEEVRKSFHQAVLDPEESRSFHDFLEDVSSSNSTVKAYKAASEAMLARVVWNPFTKLSQVMRYDKLMEMAVNEDMDNIEIRFLRLAIEYNLPKMLGLSKHLEEDKDKIVDNLTAVESIGLDPEFSRYILYFMEETQLCSQTQIEEMKERLD